MQLLNSSTTAHPQFVSLSIVLNVDDERDERSVQMVSPVLLSAPMACMSHSQALEALKELHFHLNSTIKAATEVSADPNDQIAMIFFKEDARQMEDVQLFSPLTAAGIGLYYRLIRTDNKTVVSKLANMILMATKTNTEASTLSALDGIWGFLLCVGVTGLPFVTMPSNLFYHLSERVNDCKEILTRRADLDGNAIKTLLSTLLLYENDERMTNSRIEGIRLAMVPEPDESTQKKGGGLISPLVGVRTKRSSGRSLSDGGNPSGRGLEDTVLSLDIRGADETRLITERLKVLSVAELQTKLHKYTQSAFERKSNLDLTGGTNKGRFSSRKRSSGRDADFDNFDYKGPSRDAAAVGGMGGSSSHHRHKLQSSSFHSTQSGHSKGIAAIAAPRQAVQALRQPTKDTKLKAAPILSAPRFDTGRRRGGGSSVVSNERGFVDVDDNTTTTSASGSFDPFGQQKFPTVGSSSARHNFEDEDGTVMSQAKLQVNVALNEDLSCSYRASQLSSCSVEGVVQVQVRANAQTAPFYLFLRDPSEQVESFQENRKFADDVSDAILEEDDADRKYTISVPNGESYFPVVRYKCVDDLRPVPIRVQTRAKTENEQCRVALQISSNPNNEAKLTDLTIIMGVPEDIIGETLVTQPAGGVWNDSKRCVTWCVEELAEGEKFQLQARFQMSPNARYDQTGEKPMFPVLVRCQCLFAQLSDLELEIRDIPEIYAADVTMKIARRFRLSHRERA
ncbi:hypothetical protein ACA910_008972 [Epithemia clementina (nom. ined.)]